MKSFRRRAKHPFGLTAGKNAPQRTPITCVKNLANQLNRIHEVSAGATAREDMRRSRALLAVLRGISGRPFPLQPGPFVKKRLYSLPQPARPDPAGCQHPDALPNVKPENPAVSTAAPTYDPLPDSASRAWPREVARRLATLWPVKALGTTAFMALFFWAYFSVMRYPLGVPYVMPEIALDHWIPFTATSYPVYVSLWVYVSLPPALLGNLRALLHCGLWIALMCTSCLLFFWLVPTQTPAFDIDWSQYPSMSTIKSMDAAGNAFPSLHVASAVFAALWLNRLFVHIQTPPALRWISLLLCIAIAWSTVASRQHVTLDVLAGAAVGLVFALGSLRATRSKSTPIPL